MMGNQMALESKVQIEGTHATCSCTDIFYYIAVAFLDVVDFNWSEYPNVTQWKATIASQPWFKEVWADNQAKLIELYNSKKGSAKQA